jgi:16S rRNA (guanine527-N7)-methyltransferase
MPAETRYLPEVPSLGRIQQLLAGCGLEADGNLAGQVRRFLGLLLRWNQRLNLTGLRHPDAMVVDLFAESFWAARLLGSEQGPLLDIGSGAGFPGLAIKLACPALEVFLLEPRQKRATFLSAVCRELQIPGVRVLPKRLEECREGDFARPPRLLTLRAVGPVGSLIEAARPGMDPSGKVLWFTTRKRLAEGLPAGKRVAWGAPRPLPWTRQKVLLWGTWRGLAP